MPDTSPRRVTRLLLACGAAAGPIFVAAFVVEGAVRPAYDPLRHPVSGLALGPNGWTQTANFLAAGTLTAAFAAGLHRHLASGPRSRLLPALVALWALGLVGAGLFPTDPVSGYPPGTPPLPVQPTGHGTVHDLVSIPGFLAFTGACFTLAGHDSRAHRAGWAAGSAGTGTAFAALFLLASAGFSQTAGLVEVAGLLQRLAVTIGQAWLCALAIRCLHNHSQ